MLRRLLPAALVVFACKPADVRPTEPDAASGESSVPESSGSVDPAGAPETSPPTPEDSATDSPAPSTEGAVATAPPPSDDVAASPTTDTSANPSGQGPSPTTVAALPAPLFKSVKEGCGRDKGVGTKLKPFRLKNLEGEEVTNGRYRKRVMLVNFWGTWCAPCLKELPEFSRLYRRYRKHGLTLVAIATDEDPEPVKALVEKRKLRAKFLLGGEAYAGEYGAPNFPFTYVVEPGGTIIGSYHGYKEDCMGKLEDDIRNALSKG